VRLTTAAAGWIPSPRIITCFCVPAVLCSQVGYGEQFKIVGNHKELGNWDASKALELKWNEGDVWAATAELPVATDIEFKVGQGLGKTLVEEGGVKWQFTMPQ
jgi:hypothetical protein